MTGSLTLVKMLMGFIIAKVVAIYGPSGMAMLGQIQSVVTSLNGLVNAPTSNGIIKYTAEFSPKGTEACAPLVESRSTLGSGYKHTCDCHYH